ncbi:MAG: hypothetical protein HEQ29_00835 [Dolichospermum sp. LBC05a]|jgi:hypothetical protein|nr:hypothetical protein [Dolichospermum sp. BR01]MBS9390897.1 hypothetical protein [Dolichospermum sp. WA123]MBS9391755.1 hypothetical protein [Dolichospermum sp. OL01]MCO5795404.1 hypothetical protein [Dolichospermum sp. OL03]MCS6279964.1 hypothetical protein [Dolichospermum sp.]QSV57120.1 MAG: hypothetical protein HEQ29_00835 [Dolichospermum sp. LBC05a]
MSNFGNKQTNYFFRGFTASLITIGGLLASSLPTMAVTDSYENDYRVCAAQLLSVGITAKPASQSCAAALQPRELSSCVAKIHKLTQITPVDALSSCRQARIPQDLATCVVSISKSYQGSENSATLTSCGRSLLPVTFADCVVGLRREIDLSPTQALNTCIDASEGSSGFGAVSTKPLGSNSQQ